MTDDPLTPKSAAPLLAALLGREVTETSVRDLIRRGRLAGIKRRGRVFVTRAAIDDLMRLWPERERSSKLRPRREWGVRV